MPYGTGEAARGIVLYITYVRTIGRSRYVRAKVDAVGGRRNDRPGRVRAYHDRADLPGVRFPDRARVGPHLQQRRALAERAGVRTLRLLPGCQLRLLRGVFDLLRARGQGRRENLVGRSSVGYHGRHRDGALGLQGGPENVRAPSDLA